jgi:AraC-like DNA-binding protein
VKLTGASPASYRMKRTIDRACELMQQQKLTNKEISTRLGFSDEFHFSRRFKQFTGLAPREFRSQVPNRVSKQGK